MEFKRFLVLFLLGILIFSCSSKRDILYMQDINDYDPSKYEYSDVKIDVDDILKITVNSIDVESSTQFNRISTYQSNTSLELAKMDGYLVNNLGQINFPVLGKINVRGLNVNELEEKIYNLLLQADQLINHSVEVKILNLRFTILGEVNKPGTHYYLENNLNILEAIGISGDLTINGKRDDVKLIREKNGKRKVYNIDLTKSEYLDSDYFHVKSGDIFVVSPNTTRVKNAGIIGNSGTLISLLSFLLSTVIIISN